MKNKENTLGANKQMAFLNTTKLAVLSAALLLAVFCTIGMSFTPAEEGENIGNPNDSTYITGPRRSSSYSSSCNGNSYENATDYGRVEVKIMVWDENGKAINIDHSTVGSVTLTGETAPHEATDGNTYQASITSSNSTSGTDVFIDWNSDTKWTNEWSNQNKNDDIIEACHTLNVTMEATTKGTVYEFYGWTKHIMQNDKKTYYRALPSTKPTEEDGLIANGAKNTDVIILGDVDDNGNEDGFTNAYNGDHKTTWEDSDYPHRVIYYAHFAPPAPVNITLNATETEKGSYIYSYTDSDGTHEGTISSAGATIITSAIITLTASPQEGYTFFGWYKESDSPENYLSHANTLEKKFTTPTTIYAKFIPKDAALFIIKGGDGTEYWNLNEACEKAKALSSSSKVVLPTKNGTLYPLVDGELCKNPEGKTIKPYTIPSGVTLLVPYEGGANFYTEFQNDMLVHATWAKPTCFRKLTLYEKCTIVVEGNLNVAASIYSVDGGKTGSGAPKVYGQIDMQSGSNITIKNKLYCWGFITGAEGFVEIESGGTVCESLQIQHHPGGTEASNWMRNKKALFLNQYYAQNIESPLRINTGAIEKVYATMYVYMIQKTNATFIGRTTDKDALFQLNGGYLIRKYDSQKDRIIYDFYGDFKFNYLSLNLASVIDIETTAYPLPVTNNMTVNCYPNPETNKAEMTFEYDVALLPGTEILIDKNVTANVSGSMFAYDIEAWKDNGYAGLSTNVTPVQFSPTCTYKRTIADLKDARVELNGTLNIKSGGLINTTTGSDDPTKYGADVCSSGGGVIKFETSSATEKTYQYKSNNLGTAIEIPVTAAQLHNDESKTWNQDEKYKYTQTDKAGAGDVFTYSETYGRWRCERTITWDANGGTIEPTTTIVGREEPLSLYFPESLPTPTKTGYTFVGWFTTASGGDKITIETIVKDNVTYYAQWTLTKVGEPLDIVDADGTNLTINANGWASSGWPYTINGTEYGKDDKAGKEKYRQADRTLVIPYGDKAPNEEIVIEVKDKEGTVVSSHIYKVPFVYTGTEDMSTMNENSIVFVKSDTLTVGDASAKEIYVADSAVLKVTGTLTVGKLVLRTTPFEAAILTNKGSIKGQVYYSRIARDTDFHLFAIPAGSNTADVVLSDGTSAAVASTVAPYGNAWQLREYNTARRAELGADGANWDNIGWDSIVVNGDTRDTTYSDVAIEASKGYELRSGSKYYREYLFPVTLPTTATPVQVTAATGAAGAADAGWNILCSPYTDVYKVEYDPSDPTKGIKVSWQQPDGSYIQVQPDQIKPAVPFAYQAMKNGSLDFSADSLFFKAPRKQSAAEALTETEWVHLDIFDAYGEGDETSLFVHPTRFEQTYKTGIDVAKQSLTAARPIIYSTHAYGDMAFAGIADSLLENGIDLAVYSPAAQELTFSLRENKFLHRLEYLWLADNETGARTDLLMDDYTYHANAGTTKGRFVLNGRFKAPQIATGIDNTQTDYNIYAIGNNIAISGVEQGTPIYVFDAVGHMIYTTSATSDEVIVPTPCAGVYMLTIGGQTAKLVINK